LGGVSKGRKGNTGCAQVVISNKKKDGEVNGEKAGPEKCSGAGKGRGTSQKRASRRRENYKGRE